MKSGKCACFCPKFKVLLRFASLGTSKLLFVHLLAFAVVGQTFIDVFADVEGRSVGGGQMLFSVEFEAGEAGANDPAKVDGASLLAQVQAARVDVFRHAPSGNEGVVGTARGPGAVRPLIIDLAPVGGGDDVVRGTLQFSGSDGGLGFLHGSVNLGWKNYNSIHFLPSISLTDSALGEAPRTRCPGRNRPHRLLERHRCHSLAPR